MTPLTTQRLTNKSVLVETGFTTPQIKDQLKKAAGEGFIELSDTSSLKKLDEKTTLGIVRAMSDQCVASYDSSFLTDILDQKAVITIPITQDGVYIKEEVASEGKKIISIEGDYGDRIGYMQSFAKVVANFSPRQGDVIVNDRMYGGSLVVVLHEEPIDNGDGTSTFTVQLPTNADFQAYESKANWENTYVSIDSNFRAELGTNASGINFDNGVKHLEKFFRIGSHQTVDIQYSDEAGMVMAQELGSDYFQDQALLDKISALNGKSMYILSKDPSGAISAVTIDAVKYALFEKAWHMASMQAFSGQGVNLVGSNGNIYAPKGVWRQIKDHSPRFGYSNDATFVLDLKRMSDKLYGHVADVDRVIELEGGRGFGERLRRIFANEFKNIPIVLEQDALPGQLLSGTLDNMKIAALRVSEAFLPGIGYVKFKHNVAFDYTSKNTQFMTSGNLSKSTNSAIIRDVRATYDGAKMKKAGLYDKLVYADEYQGSNFVLVKQTGKPMFGFGVNQGRSHFGGMSSGVEFKHSQYVSIDKFGVLVVDPSNVFYMEMED